MWLVLTTVAVFGQLDQIRRELEMKEGKEECNESLSGFLLSFMKMPQMSIQLIPFHI